MLINGVLTQEGLAKAVSVVANSGLGIVPTGFGVASTLGAGGIVNTRTYASRVPTFYSAPLSNFADLGNGQVRFLATIPIAANGITALTPIAEIYIEGTLNGVPFLLMIAAPTTPTNYDPQGSLSFELTTQVLGTNLATAITFNSSQALEITAHETNPVFHPKHTESNVAPTVADDASRGYVVGSTWLHIPTGQEYTCFSVAAGAAHWVASIQTTEKAAPNGVATLDAAGKLVQMPTAADVGLGSVNNTSDVNKPVSTAQQAALNGKENLFIGGGVSFPQHGLAGVGGTAITLPVDTALDTLSVTYPSGLYEVNLTVAQLGLPVGWWYIDYKRHSNDATAARYYSITATPLTPSAGDAYTLHVVANIVYGFLEYTKYLGAVPTISVEGSPSSVVERPLLTGSTFTSNYVSESHMFSNWVVKNAVTGSVVWSSLSDTVNLTSIRVPLGILKVSTSYIFSVSYITNLGGSKYGSSGVLTTVPKFIYVFQDVWTVSPIVKDTSGLVATFQIEGAVVMLSDGFTLFILESITNPNICHEFNTITGVVTNIPSPPSYVYSPSSALLPNGKVLVCGGLGASNITQSYFSYLYDPNTKSWSSTGTLPPIAVNASLPLGRTVITTSPLGAVYLWRDAANQSAESLKYNYLTGLWSQSNTTIPYNIGEFLSQGSSCSFGAGSLIVSGGSSLVWQIKYTETTVADSSCFASTVLDLVSWTSLTSPITYGAVLVEAQDGSVFLSTKYPTTTTNTPLYRLLPNTYKWLPVAPLPRNEGIGTLIPLSTGELGAIVTVSTLLIYQ